MRIYQEAGGDAKKAILSHLDRTCNHMLLNDTRCSTIDIVTLGQGGSSPVELAKF